MKPEVATENMAIIYRGLSKWQLVGLLVI